MVESLIPIERELFLLLNSPHTPFLDAFFYCISQAQVWIVFGLVLIALLSYRQKVGEVVCLLVMLGLLILITDQISSGIFKPFFQRLRPTHHPATEDVVKTVLDYKGGMYGFISSHAANFMAAGIFLSLVVRNRWFTFAIIFLMLTVSYSRIYLGVHFVTDVLGGLLLSVVTAPLVYFLYRKTREVFLQIPFPETDTPYLTPLEDRRKMITFSVWVFYLSMLIISPALIHLYSTNFFASRI